jgi:hypothetical protein
MARTREGAPWPRAGVLGSWNELGKEEESWEVSLSAILLQTMSGYLGSSAASSLSWGLGFPCFITVVARRIIVLADCGRGPTKGCHVYDRKKTCPIPKNACPKNGAGGCNSKSANSQTLILARFQTKPALLSRAHLTAQQVVKHLSKN